MIVSDFQDVYNAEAYEETFPSFLELIRDCSIEFDTIMARQVDMVDLHEWFREHDITSYADVDYGQVDVPAAV